MSLTRRQFIATSATLATATGIPVAASAVVARIAKPNGLRLVSQESDESWRGNVMNWEQEEYYRNHRLVLAVDGCTGRFLMMVHSLVSKANAASFGGIAPGHLMFHDWAGSIADENGTWRIVVQLRETSRNYLDPMQVVDMKTSKILKFPSWRKAVNFAAYLPLVEAFPAAVGYETAIDS